MSEPSEKQTTNDAPASANKDKDDIRVETEGKFSDYIVSTTSLTFMLELTIVIRESFDMQIESIGP